MYCFVFSRSPETASAWIATRKAGVLRLSCATFSPFAFGFSGASFSRIESSSGGASTFACARLNSANLRTCELARTQPNQLWSSSRS